MERKRSTDERKERRGEEKLGRESMWECTTNIVVAVWA